MDAATGATAMMVTEAVAVVIESMTRHFRAAESYCHIWKLVNGESIGAENGI